MYDDRARFGCTTSLDLDLAASFMRLSGIFGWIKLFSVSVESADFLADMPFNCFDLKGVLGRAFVSTLATCCVLWVAIFLVIKLDLFKIIVLKNSN